MKVTKIFTSLLLITILAVPAMASENWVETFLKRYIPSRPHAASTGSTTNPDSNTQLGQLLRTGEMPVTMNDVINMMLDNNLNIRADRMAPRSLYYQSLVF